MALEYLVSQGGTDSTPPDTWSVSPYFWNNTPIGYDPPNPLNGFSIGARYYIIVSNTDPQTGVTTETRSYPSWKLISQTLVVVSPDPDVFFNPTGNELFTATPGNYVTSYATAGIKNGSGYSYPLVFDQTEYLYLERDYIPPAAPPPVDGSVSADPFFPQQPYDPANGIYPTSAITKFSPDPRESVTVTYELTTLYNTGFGSSISESINITQVVTQSINNWTSIARAEINKTAYKNGLYNTKFIPK